MSFASNAPPPHDEVRTPSEARRDLFGLIERVSLDHTEVEVMSKRGPAVLKSKNASTEAS